MREKRLYKSTKNRQLAGVLGGIGEYFDIDPTLIRVLFVIIVLVTGGTGVFLYFLLSVILPYDYQVNTRRSNRGPFDEFTRNSRFNPGGRPGDSSQRKDVTPEEDDWSDF